MARTLKSDKTLFLSTLLLVGMSVVMVYSASAVQAVDRGHSAGFFLVKQLAWAVIGVLLMALDTFSARTHDASSVDEYARTAHDARRFHDGTRCGSPWQCLGTDAKRLDSSRSVR